MRMLCLTIVTAGLLSAGSLTCLAQEVLPKEGPSQEKPPPRPTPPPQPSPAPEVTPAPLVLPPDCNPGHPALKILEVEQVKPVQIIEPREVITTVTRPGLAIDYRLQKQVIIDFELKPKEVTRLVPCTVQVPCQEIDPHTGHYCTVMKEVTELKPQKEFVFVSVPVEREVTIKVPYLKEVQEEITQRNILLENRTLMQTDIAVMAVPTVVYPERYLMTPPTSPAADCPATGCPASGCHK